MGLIDEALHEDLDSKANDATRLIGGLIRYLSKTKLRGRKFKQRAEKRSRVSKRRTANREL